MSPMWFVVLLCALSTMSTETMAQNCSSGQYSYTFGWPIITYPASKNNQVFTTSCESFMTGENTFLCIGGGIQFVNSTCSLDVFSGTPTGNVSQPFVGTANTTLNLLNKNCFGWSNGTKYTGYNISIASGDYCCQKVGIYSQGICQYTTCGGFGNLTDGFIVDPGKQLCAYNCLQHTANQPLTQFIFTGSPIANLTGYQLYPPVDTQGYVYVPGTYRDLYSLGYQVDTYIAYYGFNATIGCLYKGSITSRGCFVYDNCSTNPTFKTYTEYVPDSVTNTCYVNCYDIEVNAQHPQFR